MEFNKLIHKRRACHHFIPNREVTDEDFKKIMELVRYTPSGYNAQPWEFVLVRDQEQLKKLQEIAYEQEHLSEASAVVIVLGDTVIGRHAERIMKEWLEYGYVDELRMKNYLDSMKRERREEKTREMALRNSALAAMMFILAAEDLGFATCPMMGFRQLELYKLLEIPQDRIITMMIALGHADRSKFLPQLPRKSVEELSHKEKFGESF